MSVTHRLLSWFNTLFHYYQYAENSTQAPEDEIKRKILSKEYPHREERKIMKS